MNKGLMNKVAVVTGAAQGIGRGIALRLAQEGVHVALVDLNEQRLNEVKQEIENLKVKASILLLISVSVIRCMPVLNMPSSL